MRLMSVHAHPDDESSKGAATIARYVAEGHQVMVVTCTGGEAGSILNPAMDRPEVVANLSRYRWEEMAKAAQILGVDHRWLGFIDSGLPEGDPLPPIPAGSFAAIPLAAPTEALVKEMRAFRPHVVVTYDENGGYPHPDHIRTHEVSMAAYDAVGVAEQFPQAGAPWQPLKLYYLHGFSRGQLLALHEAILESGVSSPYVDWLEQLDQQQHDDVTDRITTRIHCADYFATRDEALKAHATQIDPHSHWFAVPLALQQKAWPTEDYELIRSQVDTMLPEDDLFAGIDKEMTQ